MTPPSNSDTSETVPLRPDDSAFGARLALIRQARGWNIKEAAVTCGLPGTSWRNWEIEAHTPRDYLAVCRAIASAAQVDLMWLMGADDQRASA